MDELDARTLVSVTLIFITTLLTGFGVFDNIARFAGAGTLVPITGFANAVASPAIEAKTDDGSDICIRGFIWDNPNPEKKIAKIAYKATNKNAHPVLTSAAMLTKNH